MSIFFCSHSHLDVLLIREKQAEITKATDDGRLFAWRTCRPPRRWRLPTTSKLPPRILDCSTPPSMSPPPSRRASACREVSEVSEEASDEEAAHSQPAHVAILLCVKRESHTPDGGCATILQHILQHHNVFLFDARHVSHHFVPVHTSIFRHSRRESPSSWRLRGSASPLARQGPPLSR